MLLIQIAISIYILSMFVYLLINYRGYREIPKPSRLPDKPPPLSVIVPAEGDAEAIRACLDSLGKQDYPNMEIIILIDRSLAHISSLVEQLAREYANIRTVHLEYNETIRRQWSGQTYALHQGALKARGEWLLFLDPNLVVQPHCISRSLAYSIQEKVDFFSLMPGHDLRSFWEKLILPIVFGWFGTRFSVAKVNDPGSTQAVAVKQFMLISKNAYQSSGGFEKAKAEIFEDSALAREIKGLGLKYRLLGGRFLITSRTYGGLKEIWQRCVRLFIGEIGSSPLNIIWTFLVIALTGVVPFLSVLYCAYLGLGSMSIYVLMLCVLQCIAVLSARIVLDYVLGIGVFYAFLHPIGSIFALAILVSSLYQYLTGAIEPTRGRVSSELVG